MAARSCRAASLAVLVAVGGLAGDVCRAAAASPPTPPTPPITEIVGGTPTTGFPAVVALLEPDDDLFCTAFLIRPGCLLTAAHCVDAGLATGSTAFFGSDVTDPTGVRIELVDAVVHPGWSGKAPEFDLAVVALESAVAVPPIGVAAPGPDGTTLTLVGFGRDDLGQVGVKRTATTTLIDSDATRMIFDGATANICDGDSGGPVLRDVAGQLAAAGVASASGADCDVVGLAARIDTSLASFVEPAADSICTAVLDPELPFVDGFETGDTSLWSFTAPLR